MMKTRKSNNIVYVSDFLYSDRTDIKNRFINGGGENNDFELVEIIKGKGHQVTKVFSDDLTKKMIEDLGDVRYIISNFAFMTKETIHYLTNNSKYVIYEHDHKYLTTRDPTPFEDYKAPQENVCNVDFYKNALAVFCQSKLHSEIMFKNIEANIVNNGGNIWSLTALAEMEKLQSNPKKDKYSIMSSNIGHKNTDKSVSWCVQTEREYEVIPQVGHLEFLERLSHNKYLCFFPQTVETLSRIVVEARMLGCSLVCSQNIGALSEPWIANKGQDLIDIMKEKRESITHSVLENLLQ